MSEERFLSRDEAKAVAFIDVDLGDGLKVRARTVATLELFAAGILAPAAVETGPPAVDGEAVLRARLRKQAEETEKRLARDPDTIRKLLALVLEQPKLWTGPEADCPEGAVTFEMFAPYLDIFLIAYMPLIGYGETRRRALEFRDRAGSGGPAPARGEVNGTQPATAA